MFRPEIKVVDCSIRDGGLMNNSNFSLAMVKQVFQAINDSGVDIIELGYKNSKDFFSTEEYGPWRFCDETILREVTDGIDRSIEIAVMQDAHKAVPDDILPKSESVLDMIRIATYVKDVDKAIHLANNATDKGYKATINIMAISNALERELDEALQQIEEETNVTACYLVDSFGALYSEDIHYLVHKFQKYIKTKEIGIHCHNNQQLAFANTIEGIIKGVNYLDGTLYGIGRAAGNCPLELLIGFLKNPKFDIRPLLKVIGSDMIPLTKEIQWGYTIPYMLTGILNLHPRSGMKQMILPEEHPDKYDFQKFYEFISTDDVI
ncbi:MAG: aldolase catalytic domain-containing protein [Thermodesulfobacteriota bacterium]|nr:aldolase catalytic domain-containing protein [Thermodesulfobacteriota bacterium]